MLGGETIGVELIAFDEEVEEDEDDEDDIEEAVDIDGVGKEEEDDEEEVLKFDWFVC